MRIQLGFVGSRSGELALVTSRRSWGLEHSTINRFVGTGRPVAPAQANSIYGSLMAMH